ncbi:MAG: NADH:flavin oxidoreductase/NADH oxidase family protein [Bacilli bacterium]
MEKENDVLFSSFELPNGAVLQNRIFKSAMSEAQGDKEANPKPVLSSLYEVWGQTGIGVSVTGNVMVDRNALGEPGNVVLDEDSDLELFSKWAKKGKRNKTQLWMQLNHPGKQMPKILGKECVGPSAVPITGGMSKFFHTPRALEVEEIEKLIEKFTLSAMLAQQTGFDGIQIHAAHGYLVSQFLSPIHNVRNDEWGGSLRNRSRFLLEVYRSIRQATGAAFSIGVKLNSSDFQKGGFSTEDSLMVMKWLAEEGVDLIEISGGTYSSPAMQGAYMKESTQQREAYFLNFAKKAVQTLQTPIVVTGGWRNAEGMRDALETDNIAMVGIARPFVQNPKLVESLRRNEVRVYNEPKLKTGLPFIDKQSQLFSMIWYSYAMNQIGQHKRTPSPFIGLSLFLRMMLRMGKQLFVRRL